MHPQNLEGSPWTNPCNSSWRHLLWNFRNNFRRNTSRITWSNFSKGPRGTLFHSTRIWIHGGILEIILEGILWTLSGVFIGTFFDRILVKYQDEPFDKFSKKSLEEFLRKCLKVSLNNVWRSLWRFSGGFLEGFPDDSFKELSKKTSQEFLVNDRKNSWWSVWKHSKRNI